VIFNRQKIVGWVLIAISLAYLAYFWQVRLMGSGPAITRNEWFQVITSIVVFMIGTANVRLAAMRDRGERPGPRT
jgi:hypothetical protein